VKNPMRDFFSRVLWDRSLNREEVWVRYVSRGAAQGYEEFTGLEIVRVTRDGVVVSRGGAEKYIPYHRIVEIRYGGKEGRVVFLRNEGIYGFRL